MKSCAVLDNRHQLSHDKNLDKCLFCRKSLEEIIKDGEEYDDPLSREVQEMAIAER